MDNCHDTSNIKVLQTPPKFCPFKNDYLFRLLNKLTINNPFYAGALWFFISYLSVYLLALIFGILEGNKVIILKLKVSVEDNINMGLLAPIGAGLLCNLYNQIRESVSYLINGNILPCNEIDAFKELIIKLEKLYNHFLVPIIAALISLSLNIYTYTHKEVGAFNIHTYRSMVSDSFFISGLLHGLYGRFLIFINFFMIGMIVYKCIITVYALREIFKYNLLIQPMHPDRAAGLKPMGKLAIAVNYFMVLIIIFASILWLFDIFSRQYIFISIFILLYILSPIIIFMSLSKANKAMTRRKNEELQKLQTTFQFYYEKMTSNKKSEVYDVLNANEINVIYGLYKIVDKMPIWPFDSNSLLRLLTSMIIPFLAFIINQLSNRESIFYFPALLDYLKILFI